MKRIAIIIPGGLGEKNSPVTIPWLYNLVEGLSHRYDITVYSLARVDTTATRITPGSFQVCALPADPSSPVMKRLVLLARWMLRDHLSHRYELIHGIWGFPSGFFAVVLGKLLRIPVIVSLQGGEAAYLPEIQYGNMFHPRLRKITLWTCRHARTLTTLTRFQLDALTRFGLERDDAWVIPHGADPEMFYPVEKPFQPPFRFLHVGNLTEVKDQKTLLRAFTLIHNQVECELRIVGPDYLNGEIQHFASELGIGDRVAFYGKVSHERLPEHYQWAHFMLHTSMYEGQGVVLAEAAASGVVICGTRVGLIADLEENCAVAVDVGDCRSLAASVMQLITQPHRYRQLQTNALAWAHRHDLKWTIHQYGNLYQSLTDNRDEKNT